MSKYPGVSSSVVRRLPRYYRYLTELKYDGMERISSKQFAELMGVTASQIRQDLNCFGGFGQQGYGYNVNALHAEIGHILGVDNDRPAILIGMGNLGLALTNHIYFERQGFQLIGLFDCDAKKIGFTVQNWIIQDVASLGTFCRQNKPEVAILCVPKDAAPLLVDELVELGIKGFWNFSHHDFALQYKDQIVIENVHLSDSLMTLGFNVSELLHADEQK